MRSIVIQNKINRSEFVRAHLKLSIKNVAIQILMFLLLLSFVFYSISSSGNFPGSVLPSFLIYFLLVPFFMYRKIIGTYKESMTLNEPTVYTLSYDEMAVVGDSFNLAMSWKNLYKITSIDNFLILYATKSTAYFISLTSLDAIDRIYLFDMMKQLAAQHHIKSTLK